MQLIFRFIVGGLVVCCFAAIGDALKPKSFAGLFSAAPSVALATLALTIIADGKSYARSETRAMMVGAFAFCAYSWLCMQIMARFRITAKIVTVGALAVWFACAVSGWFLFLR
jgi:hypothetical protein